MSLLLFIRAEKVNMKNNKRNKNKMSYEPEADVLRVETSKKPIDYASEIGDVVVHFSSDGTPVYFEILEASKFIRRAFRVVVTPDRQRTLATT